MYLFSMLPGDNQLKECSWKKYACTHSLAARYHISVLAQVVELKPALRLCDAMQHDNIVLSPVLTACRHVGKPHQSSDRHLCQEEGGGMGAL